MAAVNLRAPCGKDFDFADGTKNLLLKLAQKLP
jgi:hypothetical protein